jgi:glycosyltransferase involved in cell wall biosynthesis
MRILHVVHGYPPSIGGTQRLVEKISRELTHRHGDEVTVFSTVALNMDHFIRDDGQALPAGTTTMDGVVVRRFPVFNRLTRARMLLASLSYRWHLPGNEQCRTLLNGPIVFGMTRAIARSKADVVMAAPFPQLNMYYALRGAKRAGVPIVLCGALHVEDRWNYDRKMIFRAIERADAYVSLTPFEKDHVVNRGISPEKVHVIGGGVDLDAYSKAEGSPLRRELGFGDDPVVAMVSKQVERKRFDLLLDAMGEVWKGQPSARVLLAGGRTGYSPVL